MSALNKLTGSRYETSPLYSIIQRMLETAEAQGAEAVSFSFQAQWSTNEMKQTCDSRCVVTHDPSPFDLPAFTHEVVREVALLQAHQKNVPFSDEAIEWFMRHIEITDGCWEWKGKVMNGHPYVYPHYVEKYGFGTSSARRIAYMLQNGAIPEKHRISVTCENPCCMKPTHLTARTSREIVIQAWQERRRLLASISELPEVEEPITCSQAGKIGGDKIATVRGREYYAEIGRRGGATTSSRYGHAFYQRIGSKGGQRVQELIALAKKGRA